MNRQTISQLPIDATDPVATRRFFERLTQGVDAALGIRGTNAIAEQTAAQQSEIDKVVAGLKEQKESDEEARASSSATLEDLRYDVDTLLSKVLFTRVSAESYKDFNAQAWLTIEGCVEFSALGKEMTNPPMSLSADTTYTFAVRSVKLASGCLTELSVISDRLDAVYSRFNLTQWKQLA